MIRYSRLNIAYDRVLLQDSTFELAPGTLTLLTGPSGIGKTALLYRLAMIVQDCEIESDDIDLSDINRTRREDFAFVMQGNDLVPYLSVEETLKEHARISGTGTNGKRIRKVLQQAYLDVPLNQRVSLLSLGERQRLCIACALIKKPKVIILDEPDASLDRENRALVYQLLRHLADKGHYVVFSSHEADAAEYADVTAGIRDTRLYADQKTSGQAQSLPAVSRHYRPLRMMVRHIAAYAGRNRWYMMISSLFVFMAILIMASVGAYTQMMLEKTYARLYEVTDKYLYITDGENQGLLEEDTVPVDLAEGYPVYKVMLMQGAVYIVPYGDEMDFSDKTELRLGYDRRGMYISFQAEQVMKDMMQIFPEMEFQVLEPGKGLHTWSGPCNGVLKQGVRAYFLEDSQLFIAVNHEDLETVCEGEPVGRIIYYDTLEKALSEMERYEKLGYTVNAEAVKAENIRAAAGVQEDSYQKSRRMTALIFFLILLSVKAVALWKRSYEFALMRVNGVTGMQLGEMLMMEDVPALAAALVLIVPGCLILWMLKQPMAIPYILLSWLSVMFMLCGLSLLSGICLKYMNIEKVLRS